jgi:hypothetical protein
MAGATNRTSQSLSRGLSPTTTQTAGPGTGSTHNRPQVHTLFCRGSVAWSPVGVLRGTLACGRESRRAPSSRPTRPSRTPSAGRLAPVNWPVGGQRYITVMPETVLIAIVSASAALLGSLLTAFTSHSVVRVQERQRAEAAASDAFFSAALVVLNKGLTIVERVHLLSTVARSESRPLASLDLALKLRPRADRVHIFESMVNDQEEIRFAGAQVATYADQETVALCNQVLAAATSVAAALLPRREEGPVGQLRRTFTGLPAADVQRAERAAADLTVARREFANRIRELQGRPAIDVYAKPTDAE